MPFKDMNGEQIRQAIDSGQVFAAYRDARAEFARSYAGAMAWKTVKGRRYLYRKRNAAWKSLGPEGPETETTYRRFLAGRSRVQERMQGLAARLDAMAPVNRALRLGRIPLIAARILRALEEARLTDTAIEVVGTNALYAYESLAGVRIATAHLATGDIDLLFDTRARLKLRAPASAAQGLIGLLRKVDRSFAPMGRGSFRAVNRDGYMVDLIAPAPRDRMARSGLNRVGADAADLQAVEVEGLAWLANSPKVATVAIDERGYPVPITAPDPRAFALHKAWLSARSDREPLKRQRDRAQAELVAGLVARYLPHLRFDDPRLGALPAALRRQASGLVPADADDPARALEPDW